MLVFLHIPKAAGTSLMATFKREYGRSLYRIADNRRDPKGLEDFYAMPKGHIRAVAGHVAFGIGHHLPGPVSYVTMLRDPAARLVSEWRYIRRKPKHPLHGVAMASSVPEFAASRCAASVDNLQVRMLAGEMNIGTQPFDRPVDESDLERAIANLGAFAVVGLVSEYEESLRRIADRFEWKRRPRIHQKNRSRGPVNATVDESVVAFDARLHKEAERRFYNTP